MKRVLIALIFSAIFCLVSFSQQKPFVFGFKVGPTMGWMKPDTKGYESTGAQIGYTWGFIADFFLMENYGIITGFDVVNLNAGLKMPASIENDGGAAVDGTLDRKYRLKYIQIPVAFKMQTKALGKFRIFGQIGLGTNFLIGAKANDEFTPDEGAAFSEDDVDIYDDITFMRMALILGAGVDLSLGGSTKLMAGINFNNGFMNILNGNNTVDPALVNKAKANYVSLELGIVF
jgi:hypothetical protein